MAPGRNAERDGAAELPQATVRRPRSAYASAPATCATPRNRRTTFTPTDAAQAPIVEEIDVVDQDLLFTLAGVLAF